MKTKACLLVALCMGFSFPLFAQKASEPLFQWVAIQAGEDTRTIYEDIAPAADGNFFTVGDFKSSDGKTVAYYTFDEAGQPVPEANFVGAAGLENNNTMNVVFSKIDPTGSLIWAIYTRDGDHGGMGMSIDGLPDGGAMVALKIRENRQSNGDVLCTLVDANGQDNVLRFANPDPAKYKRIYAPVLARISADGEVVWMKRYEVNLDTSVFPAMKDGIPLGGTDLVDVRDIATDAQSNSYIIGTHRASIDFGNEVVLPPARNVVDYDGRNGGNGDLFLAKFDVNGNAIWAVHTTGDPLDREAGLELKVEGNHIYLVASVEGDGKGKMQLGSFTCVPPAERSLLMACLSTDNAQVEWARFYASDRSIKPMHVNVGEEGVYFSGSMMGSMMEDGTPVLTTTQDTYHAFIVALQKETGNRQGAWVTPNSGISEVSSVAEYGSYVWATAHNMNTGQQFLYFDKQLSKAYSHFVKTKNNTEITSGGWLFNDQYVVTARYRQPATLQGCPFVIPSVQPKGKDQFSCILYSYQLPSVPVGVEEVSPSEPSVQVYAGKGEITLASTQPTCIRIYNLLGMCIYQTQLEEESLSIALPQGVYIVNGLKTMVY